MEIISHRGLWTDPTEKNTMAALVGSIDAGWGTETDLRDRLGRIVVSHDPPTGQEPEAVDFLIYAEGHSRTLALNVKADGLAESLLRLVPSAIWQKSFVFDMSIPDTRGYLDRNIPVFGRVSEVEHSPPWVEKCSGIWLDSFGPTWFGTEDIERWLDRDLRVCVVSSELHGRDPVQLWESLAPLKDDDRLLLCTDRPEQAEKLIGIP